MKDWGILVEELIDGFKAFLIGGEHESRKSNPYYAMLILTIVNVALHVLHVIIFLFIVRSWSLALVAFCGTLVCLMAFYLIMVDRGYKRHTEYILSTEMFSMAILLSLLVKNENYFHFYVFLGVFPHYFYTDVKIKSKVIITILGITIFNYLVMFKPVLPMALELDNSKLFLFVSANCFVVALIFETFLSLVSVRNRDVIYIKSLYDAEIKSMIDPLTGLWNRRYLYKKELEIINQAKNETSCVAMIDIDFFKQVNDTYSHKAGDAMLKHLSKMMIDYFRQTDIGVRWGGEEFVLILSGVDILRAGEIMDKFREHVISAPLLYNNVKIPFTFTCGVSKVDPDQILEQSINKADARLYIGKKSGRNKVVFDDK